MGRNRIVINLTLSNASAMLRSQVKVFSLNQQSQRTKAGSHTSKGAVTIWSWKHEQWQFHWNAEVL